MTKVLLICDKKNWAYDSIAQALVKHNSSEGLLLDIFYLKGKENLLKKLTKKYDLFFFLGWQLIFEKRKALFGRQDIYKKRFNFIEDKKILTGIHSHHAWDEKMSMPDKSPLAPKGLIVSLSRCCGVNAVSKRLYDIFKESGLKNIKYTPNGVDTDIFKPILSPCASNNISAGYSGSLKHDWRKGIKEFMEPACVKAGIELKKAMPVDGHYVNPNEMPHFYNDIDIYLCASSSEGFSLSVLEASSCGRPVISTRVGGSEDLIVDGDNGFLVKRSKDAIASKLKFLGSNPDLLKKMGFRNREMIERNWSWKIRAMAWIDFIEKGCSND